jgi:hypothetical protein
MLFSKKHYTLYIGKDRIDPGLVVLKDEPVFYADEAFVYDAASLPAILVEIAKLAKGRKTRIVLSEELVYVTELSFPATAELSREQIRQEAEASIPEDLHATDWDFQALQYVSKPEGDGVRLVQVAAIRSSFTSLLHAALATSDLRVENMLPESCALAVLEPSPEELSVIVTQNGPKAFFSAVRDGFVVTSQTKEGDLSAADLTHFVAFVERKAGVAVSRVIGSRLNQSVFSEISSASGVGRPCVQRDMNPLVGIALKERISGDDDEVLNLAVLPKPSRGIFR